MERVATAVALELTMNEQSPVVAYRSPVAVGELSRAGVDELLLVMRFERRRIEPPLEWIGLPGASVESSMV